MKNHASIKSGVVRTRSTSARIGPSARHHNVHLGHLPSSEPVGGDVRHDAMCSNHESANHESG